MQTGAKGLNLIRKKEAYRQFAYPDPGSVLAKRYPKARWGFLSPAEIFQTLPASARSLSGKPWTVGYGETGNVDQTSTRTKSEAEMHLLLKIKPFEQVLTQAITVETTQEQFDAMMSLAWNIGTPSFKTSTVLKAHNRKDWTSAARAFGLFNKVRNRETGQLEVWDGLVVRRAEESALYLSRLPKDKTVAAVVEEPHIESLATMEVAPESTPAESTINRAAVVGGATTSVVAVSEVSRAVSDIKDNVATLQDWYIPILLIAVVALCGYIIWQRRKQRKEGWA